MPDPQSVKPFVTHEFAVMTPLGILGSTFDRQEAEALLVQQTEGGADAHIAVRSVHQGPWRRVDAPEAVSPADFMDPELRTILRAARDVATRTNSIARDPSLPAELVSRLAWAVKPWMDAVAEADARQPGGSVS